MLVPSLLLLVLYIWWLNTPRLKYPELAKEVLGAAQARHQADQRYAHDPEMNGFLNPTFLPLWGPSARESEEDCDVLRRLKAWARYSSRYDENSIPHQERFGDDTYCATRADFLELYDELKTVLDKPVFVLPRESISALVIPELMAPHYLSQALLTLADSLSSEGHADQARQVLLDALKLSLRFRRLGYMMPGMLIGMHLEGTLDAVCAYVPLSTNCPEVWDEIAELCLQTPEERDDFTTKLEDSTAFLYLAMRNPEWPRLKSWLDRLQQYVLVAIWNVLGLEGRESRFYLNAMCHRILQARKGSTLPPPRSWLSLIGNRMALDGDSLKYTTSDSHLFSRRNLGLGLAAALLAYRARQGKFPESLHELNTSRDLSAATWDKESRKLSIEIDRNLAWKLWNPGTNCYSDEPWMTNTPTGWLYHLA